MFEYTINVTPYEWVTTWNSKSKRQKCGGTTLVTLYADDEQAAISKARVACGYFPSKGRWEFRIFKVTELLDGDVQDILEEES